MARGKFITVEGVEGVGKSTNLQAIQDFLAARGIRFIATREPGGTVLSEAIRSLLLQDGEEAMDETAELLLMFAARAQHLSRLILPALEQGTWVVCDRFTDATYAYQGGGRGIDKSRIASLESLVQGSLRPDLTIILDLDPAVGLARAAHRGELDRFEKERGEFFSRVRAAYLAIARQESKRCVVIDAGRPIGAVRADVERALEVLLGRD